MSMANTPEVQEAFDAYVALWHRLEVSHLQHDEAVRLSNGFIEASQRIRLLTGKRPGDFPEIIARIS